MEISFLIFNKFILLDRLIEYLQNIPKNRQFLLITLHHIPTSPNFQPLPKTHPINTSNNPLIQEYLLSLLLGAVLVALIQIIGMGVIEELVDWDVLFYADWGWEVELEWFGLFLHLGWVRGEGEGEMGGWGWEFIIIGIKLW